MLWAVSKDVLDGLISVNLRQYVCPFPELRVTFPDDSVDVYDIYNSIVFYQKIITIQYCRMSMVKSTEYNIAARQILSTYIHSIVIKTILFVYLGHDPSLTDRDARKIIVCSIYST